MTAAFGGTGGSNLGTTYGKVRIDYETNSTRAVKEAEAVSHSFVNVGGAATSAAKEVTAAAGQINKFAAATAQVNRAQIKNPADGLARSVQNETSGATASLTKMMDEFKKNVVKGMNIDAPIKITPKDVTIDQASFVRAIESWKQTAHKELSIDDFAATIKINPNVVTQAGAVGKATHEAFCAETKKIQECGDQAAIGFGARLLNKGKSAAGAAGSAVGNVAGSAISLGLKGGVTAAAAGATVAVAAVGYTLAKGFSRLENIDLAATKLKGLGHSGAEVKSIMDSALKAVDKTAFSLDQAATTAAQAVAAGIKPGTDLTNYLKEVADNAAVAGTSMEDMGYVFNQVATTGKLTGDVLDSLQSRGIPVLQYLAKEYGVTQSKAAEMVSAGQVDFAHFREAMNANQGAAGKMGNSISGSLDNLKTAFAKLGAELLSPLFGKATGEASGFALAIQKVTDFVKGLSNYLETHRKGMIDFWADGGKAALLFGHGVIDVVGWIIEGIGKLIEGIGHVPSAFAGIADFFGAHGIAGDLRHASDNMTNWGQTVFGAGQKVFKVNPQIDKLWKALQQWSDNAKNASDSTDDLGDSADGAAGKTTTLADALDKLGLKADQVSGQIEGSASEYRKLLDELAKKGAAQDVIDTVQKLRDQWENGGEQIKSFADAIDSFGDAAESADSKAQKFIASLKALGAIPDDSALIKYNQDVEEAIGYQSKLVDALDKTGNGLVQQGGQLDLNYKNARTLSDQISKISQDAVSVVASGKASPDEAYAHTTDVLQKLLKQFGITGDAAQQVIDKYFPKNAFDDALKQSDPKKAIEELFKGDPAKIQSELTLLTSTKDILNQLLGPDGTLHVPTVLDVQTPGAPGAPGAPPGAPGPGAPGTPGPNVPAPSGNPRPTLGQVQNQGWTNVAGQGQPPLLVPKNAPPLGPNNAAPPGWYWEFNDPNAPDGAGVLTPTAAPNPGANGVPQATPPGTTVTPTNLPPILSGPGGPQSNPAGPQMLPGVPLGTPPPDFSKPADTRSLWAKIHDFIVPQNFGQGDVQYGFPDDVKAKLDDEAKIRDILSKNSDLQQVMGPRLDAAKASGQSFSEAFAAGINSGDEEVKKAIEQIALLAGAGLGQSPALYGPLSGKGWTLYRGQKFTQDWAKGIAAEGDSVANSVTGIASSAASGVSAMGQTSTFDDKWKKTISDMQEFSDFGKHLLDFGNQLSDLAFGSAKLFNDMSGGRLFPKQYVPDTSIDPRRGTSLPGWNPQGWNPYANRSSGVNGGAGNVAAPGALGANAGKQDIANYIINKALSQGYSRDQANAIATQAFGESGFAAGISGGPQGGSGAADTVLGVFQEKPAFAQAGGIDPSQRTDPQANIDAYFNNLAKAGGPSTSDIKGLLANVSGGGPAHPSNVGHWDRALAGVAPYLQNYSGPSGANTGQGPSGTPQLPPSLAGVPNAGLPGAGVTYTPDWMVQHGFAPLFTKSGGDAKPSEIPAWMQALAQSFNLPISSHADSTLHGGQSGRGNTLQPSGSWAVDIGGPGSDPKQMEALAKFLEQNYASDIVQLIHRSATTDYGIAGGANVGGPRGQGSYYTTGEGYNVHGDHVHVAFARPIGQPGAPGQPAASATPSGSAADPLNVALPQADSNAIQNPAWAGPLTEIPQALQNLNDPYLNLAMNQGITNQADASTALQHIDGLIDDQNKIISANQGNDKLGIAPTDEQRQAALTAKDTVDALNSVHSNLQQQYGLKEAPSQLEQIQSVVSGMSGIASDVFGVFDDSLKYIAGVQDFTDTMVRGVANTKDVMRLIDDFQTGIQLAARIFQTAGDITSFAGSFSGGADFGGASAAGQALSMIGQALQAVNTAIDLGQEAYKITTKYVGRFLESWFGLPGSNDVRFLLDEMSGQLKVYSSDNPDQKTTFNTLGRELGSTYPGRPAPTNILTIYQGPGQDPRDTMDDAMFSVRASGVGAFGYAD